MAQVLNDIKKHLDELLDGIVAGPGSFSRSVLLLEGEMMEIFDVWETPANPLLIVELKLEIF